jgi:hypothetical protein
LQYAIIEQPLPHGQKSDNAPTPPEHVETHTDMVAKRRVVHINVFLSLTNTLVETAIYLIYHTNNLPKYSQILQNTLPSISRPGKGDVPIFDLHAAS